MKIRFQADADLNEDILSGVTRREPGIDFRTAVDAGFGGAKTKRYLQWQPLLDAFSSLTI